MKAKYVLAVIAMLVFQCRSQQQGIADTVTLENTYWRLVEVEGMEVKTPPDGREVYMTLERKGDEQRLKGHAGCNGLGGNYTLDGTKIKFQPITTRMYCDSQMEVENKFTRMLTLADTYRVSGTTLELYAGEELLGKFSAGISG